MREGRGGYHDCRFFYVTMWKGGMRGFQEMGDVDDAGISLSLGLGDGDSDVGENE